MMRSRLVLASAALLTTSALLVGCSDDATSDDKPDGRDRSPVADGAWSLSGALEEIPDAAVDERVWVQAGDLVAAAEAAGVERSADGDPHEWVLRITGIGASADEPSPVFVPLPEVLHPGQQGQTRLSEVVGIDALDVDGFVTQTVPPTDFTVLTGDALGPDGLSDGLIDHEGILTDIEGEDLAPDFARINDSLSRLGRPTRIKADSGAVALSTRTALVQQWRTDTGTLADREPLRQVAAELDERGVFAAVLTEIESGGDLGRALLGQNYTPAQAEKLLGDLEQHLPEASYDAVGIGWAVEDGEARIHVSYHFVGDDASEGLAALEKAWADAPSLRGGRPLSDFVTVIEGEVDGSVATVTLGVAESSRAQVVYDFLVNREAVFISR